MEGDENRCQPSPAVITPYQRLTNALQNDPRCAQEVKFFSKDIIFNFRSIDKMYHIIMPKEKNMCQIDIMILSIQWALIDGIPNRLHMCQLPTGMRFKHGTFSKDNNIRDCHR